MSKKIGMIADGINIDHIPQGNAWDIVKLLKLNRQYPVGIGLNLESQRMGIKDLLKIENYRLSTEQLNTVSIFALGATYNEIENYVVVRKTRLNLPESIVGILLCPNHRCISHQYRSLFKFYISYDRVIAHCHYCEHHYDFAESIAKRNLKLCS